MIITLKGCIQSIIFLVLFWAFLAIVNGCSVSYKPDVHDSNITVDQESSVDVGVDVGYNK